LHKSDTFNHFLRGCRLAKRPRIIVGTHKSDSAWSHFIESYKSPTQQHSGWILFIRSGKMSFMGKEQTEEDLVPVSLNFPEFSGRLNFKIKDIEICGNCVGVKISVINKKKELARIYNNNNGQLIIELEKQTINLQKEKSSWKVLE